MTTTPAEPIVYPPSLLLAAGRSLVDPEILARIGAGVSHVARTKLAAGKQGTTDKAWNYAVSALMNPTTVDPSMAALVTTDTSVAGKIIVSPDGTWVDTTPVTDALILTSIQANWNLVAAKYPTDPLTGATVL